MASAMLITLRAVVLQRQAGPEVGDEPERRELDQHVEAEQPGDAERPRPGEQVERAPNWTVLVVSAK